MLEETLTAFTEGEGLTTLQKRGAPSTPQTSTSYWKIHLGPEGQPMAILELNVSDKHAQLTCVVSSSFPGSLVRPDGSKVTRVEMKELFKKLNTLTIPDHCNELETSNTSFIAKATLTVEADEALSDFIGRVGQELEEQAKLLPVLEEAVRKEILPEAVA